MNRFLVAFNFILILSVTSCKSELFPVANFSLQEADCVDTCVAILNNESLYAVEYQWVIDGDTVLSEDATIKFDQERRYMIELKAFNDFGESDSKVSMIDFEFFRLEALSATISELPLIAPDNLSGSDVYVRFLDKNEDVILASNVIDDQTIQDVPFSIDFPNNSSIRPGTYTVQVMDKDEGEDDVLYEYNNVVLSTSTRTLEFQNTPTRNSLTLFFRKKGS